MTTYHIVTEFHTSKPTHYRGKDFPGTDFHYAIRRDDGTLVFRAGTIKFANELLTRLEHYTRGGS